MNKTLRAIIVIAFTLVIWFFMYDSLYTKGVDSYIEYIYLLPVPIIIFFIYNVLYFPNPKYLKRITNMYEHEGRDIEETFEKHNLSKNKIIFSVNPQKYFKILLDEINVNYDYFTDGHGPKYKGTFQVPYKCENCGHILLEGIKKGHPTPLKLDVECKVCGWHEFKKVNKRQ